MIAVDGVFWVKVADYLGESILDEEQESIIVLWDGSSRVWRRGILVSLLLLLLSQLAERDSELLAC